MMKNIVKLGMASAFLLSSFAIASAQNQADQAKNNKLDTEAKIGALFLLYGVDATTFKNTFNSFSVVAKVKRADELVRRYQAQSTPTVIVNGKYLTTGQQAGTYEAWFQVIDELAAREHAPKAAAN